MDNTARSFEEHKRLMETNYMYRRDYEKSLDSDANKRADKKIEQINKWNEEKANLYKAQNENISLVSKEFQLDNAKEALRASLTNQYGSKSISQEEKIYRINEIKSLQNEINEAKNNAQNFANASLKASEGSNSSSNIANPSLNRTNVRSNSSFENLYTNDKLKAAQYAYDAKMHTPSSILKSGSNVSLAGVVGSTFGHATKNITSSGVRIGINALKEGTIMGAGAIAQDEGTRKSMEAVKYTSMATTALVGDVARVAKQTNKNIAAAASQMAGLERFQLSELNKNVLTKHFGKSNILGMTDKEVSLGCLSYLNGNGVKISEDILHGNAALSIKKINKLLKGTSDQEVTMVLNALKGNILKKTFKPDFSMPKFQLLNIGVSVAGNMKYKLLSHEELKGLNVLANIKDKGTTIARNVTKFFQNVKHAAQRAAVIGRKGLLLLKRTKLFDKIYKKGLSKVTNKVSRTVAKKAGVKAGRYAHKFTEKAIKHSLREAMSALMKDLMAKTFGKVAAKIVATKVGAFIAEKIAKSTVINLLADFAAKWIPVIGQIYFVVEIVVVLVLVVLITIMAISVKTVMDDIGNVGAYPSESLTIYGDTLKEASKQYKFYFDAVQNYDSDGLLNTSRKVPKIVSKLTDNINIAFTDYMAVGSYDSKISTDGEGLRAVYGNQPEILMMIHVMSDYGLYYNDDKFIEKYRQQCKALYNQTHIMYITYYQQPYSKKNNVDLSKDENWDDVYQYIWNEGMQAYEIDPNTLEPEIIDNINGQDIYGPNSYPKAVGKTPKKPATMNVKWNSDVSFDVYYYDDLFAISNGDGDVTNNFLDYASPQVYVKYTQGIKAVSSSDSLPMKDTNVNECMAKVHQAVSKKLDEKGIHNADPAAITAGIVANLMSEGACRANNYEDTFNKSQQISDDQVTTIYNSYLDKGNITDAWNALKAGDGNNGNELKGGYGICQWTTDGRKQGLFEYALNWDEDSNSLSADENASGTTIDNLDMQIDYMLHEMEERGYFSENGIFRTGNASSIGYYLCQNFEIPLTVVKGDMSACEHRAKVASTLYNSCNGLLGDIDYDDEEMNDYVDYIMREEGEYDEYGVPLTLSYNYYVMNGYDDEYNHNSDIMIKQYLDSQKYRPAPEDGDVLNGYGHLVTHIYHGSYGDFKNHDLSDIESGDMIVWNDFAAIYIGNGKVLCCQSVAPESNEEPIGKFFLADVIKVMGNDYQVVAPIKDIEETEETQEN